MADGCSGGLLVLIECGSASGELGRGWDAYLPQGSDDPPGCPADLHGRDGLKSGSPVADTVAMVGLLYMAAPLLLTIVTSLATMAGVARRGDSVNVSQDPALAARR